MRVVGLRLRQVGAAIAGGWVAALFARVVFGDLIGLGGWALGGLLIAFTLVGLAGGIAEARGLRPMPGPERRNAVLGWGFAFSLVPVGACLYIEMPWGALAAIGTAMACAVLVRALAGPASGETGRPSTESGT